MAYVITFMCGALVGILAVACCSIAGEDDLRNGRK